MQLKVLGAAGTVTGSSYVLTSQNGQSILIDLGMFQGTSQIEALNHQRYAYDCRQLSAALLTHAHLDHCGRLPILVQNGFKGKIWMTPATYELVELSLYDSAKIGTYDPDNALYDKKDVQKTLERVRTIEYHQVITIGDFKVEFYDAGHLLGSASIVIEDTSSTAEMRKIVFSGDIGNYPEELLETTEFIDAADAVVMESTYGDRLHPDLNALDALQEQINAVEASGGALLVPSFALEKTQELLHMIMHLKEDGKVDNSTPVYLDSPMAQKATVIHTRYIDLFNDHLESEFKSGGDPFNFPGLEVIMSPEESRAIHKQGGPKVIIAGGGMMTGGRILAHAVKYLPDPKSRIFIVGYQGDETLGRSILEGEKNVMIDKTSIQINATVSNTRAMSSHADQQQLLDWLKAINGVKKVIITHGDNGPRAALKDRIVGELGITDVVLPEMNEEFGV